MSKIHLLVGLPSSGKSTYIENLGLRKPFILSNDEVRQNIATEHGVTYDETFTRVGLEEKAGDIHDKFGEVKEIEDPWTPGTNILVYQKIYDIGMLIAEEFNFLKEVALSNGNDVVLDLTNMSIIDRDLILTQIGLEDRSKVIVYDFHQEDPSYLNKVKYIANNRAKELKKDGIHKTIPDATYDRISSNYEPPTLAEGFGEIIHVDNINDLLKSVIDKDLNKISEICSNKSELSTTESENIRNIISKYPDMILESIDNVPIISKISSAGDKETLKYINDNIKPLSEILEILSEPEQPEQTNGIDR